MSSSMRGCALVALASLLPACASVPPPRPTEGVIDSAPLQVDPGLSAKAEFERTQRERAATLTRQKRWAEAAVTWEVLSVLRPDLPEYSDRLAETSRAIDVAVVERSARAAQASRRGDIDGASQQYLAVLALQPHSEAAREALRGLERERNKRDALGKYSRRIITRRVTLEAELAPSSGRRTGRNEVEHASMLAGDGEYAEAISLLERWLATDRNDDPARRLLASVYYRQGESLLTRDPEAAVQALRKSARLDPEDPHAAVRLMQLKGKPSNAANAGAASAAATSKPSR